MNSLKIVKKGRSRRGGFTSQSGFTLAEVMLSLVVLAMMTMMFGAVFPMTIRAASEGNNYSQAALLAQRKVDQIRQAQYGSLVDNTNGTAQTKLSRLGVVDATQNSDGTYSFTTIDHMTGPGGFFPDGSTGTIKVGDYNADPSPSNAGQLPSAGQVASVTITITWTGRVPGSYTVAALIPSMTHS